MHEEFFSYKSLVLGFILDVAPQRLQEVKTALVEAVMQLESDDRAYIFHPDDLEVKRNRGAVVGSIARYEHPTNFEISHALKHLVYLVGGEDEMSDKHIFVIVDELEEKSKYQIASALKLDLRENYGCNFTFCELIPSDFSQIHPRCKHVRLNNQLKETIINTFKGKNGEHN